MCIEDSGSVVTPKLMYHANQKSLLTNKLHIAVNSKPNEVIYTLRSKVIAQSHPRDVLF